MTDEGLAAEIRGCTACPELVATRTTVVVGELPVRPRLVLVGEAPGAQEDLVGRPFVGRAGQLLDRLLADAGIPREEVGVLNTLKCRPPDNRTPRAAELARCRPWLQQQLALAAPSLVVAMGATAVGWFHGRGARVAALRGRYETVGGVRVLATYHPSAALRFGPKGAPMAALREDLVLAARLL
ncbi:MAG: uracil-DNA glycosylase [Mycobacteriales bacterium]